MGDGAASLSASGYGRGGDRISTLHEDLLRQIITRLPATDAARTAAFSSRWRHLWRSTPLVLYDRELPAARRTAIVARALAEHPGPFRTVSLVDSSFPSLDLELADWPRLLADKGTQELVLYNKPTPTGVSSRLPADILRCASLQRLALAFWTFPDDPFPNPITRLLDVELIYMSNQEYLDYLLAASPDLETLALVLNDTPERVHLRSQSLRRVLVRMSCRVKEFAVVEAPLLDWLVVFETPRGRGGAHHVSVNVKIVGVPNLRVLGYLEPRIHRLQIGDNIIQPDTRASPSTVVPGVKILAIKVNFGVLSEIKMLASFLRCFPNVDTLHIQSVLYDQSVTAHEPTAEHIPKFWQEVSPAECLRSHVTQMVMHGFRGDQNELEFLKFTAMNAQELQSLLVVSVPDEIFPLTNKVNEMINQLRCPRFRPWTAKGLLRSPKPWNISIFEKLRVSDHSVDDLFF